MNIDFKIFLVNKSFGSLHLLNKYEEFSFFILLQNPFVWFIIKILIFNLERLFIWIILTNNITSKILKVLQTRVKMLIYVKEKITFYIKIILVLGYIIIYIIR